MGFACKRKRKNVDPSLIFQYVAGLNDAIVRDNVSGTNFSQTYAGTNRTRTTAAGLNETVAANVPVIDHVGASLTPALRVEPQGANILLGTPPTTQDLTLGLGSFTLQVFGAGTAVSSAGTATITGAGTASNGTPNTFTVTAAGTVTITITTATVVWLVPGSIPSAYFAGAASATTGSVTQANMRLSAVNGTAFVDFSAGTDLNGNLGKYLRVTDSAGKSVYGFIKAAGTGETFGANLLINPTFDVNATGWSAVRCTLASIAGGQSNNCLEMTNVGGNDSRARQNIAIINGASYDISQYLKIGTASPSDSGFILVISGGSTKNVTITPTSSWQQFTTHITSNGTSLDFGVYAYSQDTKTNLVDEVVFRQRLTPAATGITIVSTPGGATYNWASQDTGFNYNDSSGYTYTILGTVRATEANTTTLGIPTAVSNALAASGTIVIKGRFAFARAAGVVTNILASAAATNSLVYTTTAAGNITSNDGTTIAENAGAYTANADWKIALKWPSDTDKYRIGIDVDGAGIVWGTEVAFDGAFTATANLILGYVLHGPTWIKWVKIYDKVLTDAQINAIS